MSASRSTPQSAPRSGNLLSIVEEMRRAAHERVDTLVARSGVVIERIVSTGQASPRDFWYDSPRDEWVVLLSGAARLEFDVTLTGDGTVEEGSGQLHEMQPGDYLLIEAHRRHRVAWTHESMPTVWLAVHYG